VTLSDVSQSALAVAQENATALNADVTILKSDLLEDIDGAFDVIVANLPYVDRSWDTPPDLAHEPAQALFAGDSGLELIKKLITQSIDHCNHEGYLLLEADPVQHADILAFAQGHGYRHTLTRDYTVVMSRM